MSNASANANPAARIAALEARNAELTRQLEWFRRQLFGAKSEKRLVVDAAVQPILDGWPDAATAPPAAPATETVSYERRKGKQRGEADVTDEGLRFDASVPVERIELSVPSAMADAFEVIGHKTTRRLAQRPASYVVLEYVRPVVKRKSDGAVVTVPAPDGLWRGAMADVSVVAGVLVDKFSYHLPLHRQHQRMAAAGVTLARSTLTNWVHRAAALLEPIYQAQLRSILTSKTLAIDETPIKAGRAKGRMKTAWYWPVYGEADEVAFTWSPSRGRGHLERLLDGFEGTLLSDGAGAYARFAAERPALRHAQCWSHTRRAFVKAEAMEPMAVAEALALIGRLYAVEAELRERDLEPEQVLVERSSRALPAVDAFFAWCGAQCQRMDLTPSNPLAKAIAYAQEREGPLRVYLSDPSVAIDTNHLERALRTVPMGRKNWLFCWTEVGAEKVGIVQSLLTTCRLQGVDPYRYLVDVLQRIAIHPDSRIDELTPRRWKALFANEPLRSDLDPVGVA